MTSVVFSIVASALGLGYIMYGKRRAHFVPLVAGIGLCAYTYFVDSVLWLSVIGVALAAAPFIWRED